MGNVYLQLENNTEKFGIEVENTFRFHLEKWSVNCSDVKDMTGTEVRHVHS